FCEIDFSPRWVAADEDAANVEISYAASGAAFAYDFAHSHDGHGKGSLTFDIRAKESRLNAHVLLPADATEARVEINGESVASTMVNVGESRYADFACDVRGVTRIEVGYHG